MSLSVVFFNDTSPTEIYTYLPSLSLHDALPCCKPHHRGDLADPSDELSELPVRRLFGEVDPANIAALVDHEHMDLRLRVYVVKGLDPVVLIDFLRRKDRKSTRLNSSH